MTRTPIYLLLGFFIITFSISSCRTDPRSTSSDANASVVAPELVSCKIRANPDYVCPYQSFRAYTNTVMEYTFQKLLERDKSTLQLVPILAKSIPEIVPITEGKYQGGYSMTYEILDEAIWDNGSPITAKDYLTTMKLVFNPAGSRYAPIYHQFLDWYADIELDADNPKKFTVIASKPNYKLLDNSGHYVIPAYHYDPEGRLDVYDIADFRIEEKRAVLKDDPILKSVDSLFTSADMTQTIENIVGSGPYRVSEWNQNVNINVAKKDNWWGAKLLDKRPGCVATAKTIRSDIIPDETSVKTKKKNGEIDIVNTISGNAFAELKDNELVKEQYDFANPETLSMNYLGINNRLPKFSDRRVRQAISCLLDREGLVREVYQGNAIALYGPIAPKYPYAHNEPAYSFDVDRARRLLSEAGWEDTNGNGTRDKMIDGERVEMTIDFLSTPTNVTVQQMLLLMQDDFKKAGIMIQHKALEARELVAERRKGNFEIFTAASTLTGDHYEVYQYWHTESELNYFGAGSAEIDQMIEQIIETTDEQLIHDRMIDLQKKLEKEQYIVFITTPLERMLLNKRLKNYKVTTVRPNYMANYPHL